MKRIDVSIGKRVRLNGRIPEAWWFKPGQAGTVVGFTNDINLPINVDVDGSTEDNPAHVSAEMIDPIDDQSLLEQIAADVKDILEYVESQKAENERRAWMRSMGV